MLKQQQHIFKLLFGLVDIGVLLLAWVAGFAIRALASKLEISNYAMPAVSDFTFAIIFSAILVPIVFARLSLYNSARIRSIGWEMGRLIQGVALVCGGTFLFCSFVLNTLPSRILFTGTLFSWLFLVLSERLILRKLLRHLRARHYNLRSAAIVGTQRVAGKVLQSLQKNDWLGINTDYFVTPNGGGSPGKDIPLHKATPDEIADLLSEHPVDMVFLALPPALSHLTNDYVENIRMTNAAIFVVPDFGAFQLLKTKTHRMDDLQIIGLTYSPVHNIGGFVKHALDIAVSALGLILLSPLLLLITILVKLTSKGPVFYNQVRCSYGGKQFNIHKFRTMLKDAEKTGPKWSGRIDSRVTKVGKILRITNLDELPQLWNVLRGELSLVGPRPERPEFIEQFRDTIPNYVLRSHIKAGMTGWAQIHGFRGSDTSLRKRIQYDLYYIRNWSVSLDMRILFLTFIRRKNSAANGHLPRSSD